MTSARQFIHSLQVRHFSERFHWNASALNGFSLKFHSHIRFMTVLRPVFIKTGRRTVMKRMCEWNFRLNPFKAEAFQWKRSEKWRTCSEWMNCRAEVMHEAR